MKQYTLLSCIESKMIHPTQLYGRFELGSFATGQAVTVANTLRRALLSQLPGVAITLAHIANVSHEYESVPGIQEPVLDILSNLKKIVFTSEFEVFQPQIGYLHLKGPAVVRAGDLKLPFFITCVHPEQYITTLTEHGDFRLTVLINSGKQYLNHTPDSTGYNWRVSLLKQQLSSFNSTPRVNRNFYLTWHQQRKANNTFHFLDRNAHFVKSKIAQKLWKRQQFNRQAELIKKIQNKTFKKQVFSDEKTTPFSLRKTGKTVSPKDPKQIGETYLDAMRKLSITKKQEQLLDFTTYIGKRNKEFNTTGYFPVNAFFSPVTKVNYTIQTEENRVGEYVFLEIWTNGSIDPRRAIHRSVKALIKLFLPFQLVQHENNQFIRPEKINHQKINQIKKAEFKKTIRQSMIPIESLSQSEQTTPFPFEFPVKHQLPAGYDSATDFLQNFIKKRAAKPLRRKNSKKQRWPTKWSQLQKRRCTPPYTYLQPVLTVANPSLFAKKRQVLRYFRLYFPLFNILDRLIDSYGLTSNQYEKLSRLNILNLELPFGIYKFLWYHNLHTIGDLFFLHTGMINESMSTNKKISFYRFFHTAFSKLFYQWTGKTQKDAKVKTDQKYTEKAEERQKNQKKPQKSQQSQPKK